MSGRPSFLNPPFPEKNLIDGEVVVIDLKPHLWYFARSMAAVVVSAVVLIWAVTWDGSNVAETVGGILLAATFCASAVWLLLRWLRWRSTHFVVTSDRVVYRRGVVVKRGVAIPLERVTNINFHQSLWERVIRSGDLQIDSAGHDGQQFFFDIRRPAEVENLIHAQIEDRSERGRGDRPGDRAARLERLEALRDRGTLSESEFQREKERLLDEP